MLLVFNVTYTGFPCSSSSARARRWWRLLARSTTLAAFRRVNPGFRSCWSHGTQKARRCTAGNADQVVHGLLVELLPGRAVLRRSWRPRRLFREPVRWAVRIGEDANIQL